MDPSRPFPPLERIFSIVKQKYGESEAPETERLPYGMSVIVNTFSESYTRLSAYETTMLFFQVVRLFENCIEFCRREVRSEAADTQTAVYASSDPWEWESLCPKLEDEWDLIEPPEAIAYLDVSNQLTGFAEFQYFPGGQPPWCDNFVFSFHTSSAYEKMFLEKFVQQFGLSSIHEILAYVREKKRPRTGILLEWLGSRSCKKKGI